MNEAARDAEGVAARTDGVNGGGVMGALIRAHDWGATPLGPTETWPAALKTAVTICLDSSFITLIWWGSELIQLYNDAALSLLGARHPRALGQPARASWAEIWPVVGPRIERVVRHGETVRGEDLALVSERDGVLEEAFFTFFNNPLRDDEGRVAGVLITSIDTTAHVRTLVELRESQARFRVLGDTLPLIVSLADANGNLLYVNPYWATFSGRSTDDFVTGDWFDAVHVDDQSGMLAGWQAALASEHSYEYEFRARSADGEYRWLLARGRPAYGPDGQVAYWVNVAVEIDAHKRAEAVLRASEARQAFLVRLSDHLRPLSDALLIQETASRLLGEQLRAQRAFYATISADGQTCRIERAYHTPDVGDNAGTYTLPDKGLALLSEMRAGRTVVVADVDAAMSLAAGEQAAYRAQAISALVSVPLIKQGRWVALLGVHSATPRGWTAAEIALIEETAERTWESVERALAEAAQRTSAAQYHALFTSIDVGFCVVQIQLDATGTPEDYLILEINPAFERHTGLVGAVGKLARNAIPGLEMHWVETYGRVALTGKPVRFINFAAGLEDRWFEVYAFPTGEPVDLKVAILFTDITERQQAEEALRIVQERQAFLLTLSDALRPLGDAADIERAATRLLGEALGASRVFYAAIEADGDTAIIRSDYVRGIPSAVGRYSLSAFAPELVPEWRAGRRTVTTDVDGDPRFTDAQSRAYASVSARAALGVPLVKDGRLVAVLGLNQATARVWTAEEIALIEETAERTWAAVERAHIEAALRESEARFRSVLDNSLDAIYRFNMRTQRYEYFSPAFERVVGWSAAEMLARSPEQAIAIIHPDDLAVARTALAHLLVVGTAKVDYRVRDAQGSYRWLSNHLVLTRDDAGAPLYRDGTVRNITEQKQAEQRLAIVADGAAFRVRLADALRSLADTTAIEAEATRVLGEHLGVNRALYVEIEGALPNEVAVVTHDYVSDAPSLVGRYPLAAFGPTIVDALSIGQTIVIADIATEPGLTEAERAAYLALDIRAFVGIGLVKSGAGTLLFGVHQTTPRTWMAHEVALVEETAERTWSAIERARAEAAMRTSEERFQQIAHSVDAVFYITDVQRRQVLYISPAYSRLWGLSTEELIRDQNSWLSLVHPDDQAGMTNAFATFVANGPTYDVQYRVRLADGRERWIHDRATVAARDRADRIARITGIAEDITDRKAGDAERERLLAAERVAREEAEGAIRARDTFLSIAAHELRTPVAGLKGTTQLLARRLATNSLDSDRLARTIAVLNESADRLARLTDELLDVARIDAGALPLAIHPTDLVAMTRAAIARLAEQPGMAHRLLLDAPDEAVLALADHNRIDQVLTNLLDNAVKYSPAGGTVRVTVRDGAERVTVAVVDAGIGLPAGSEEAIFAPFGRAPNAAASHLPGMGLGLFICRTIVERHGGAIKATSAGEGQGATVEFWLPCAPASQQRALSNEQ